VFETSKEALLSNLQAAHDSYYNVRVFTGPTLYFHERALATRDKLDQFPELCYALLVSWGMHRLGPDGPKMVDFPEFRQSLKVVWPKVRSLRSAYPANVGEENWGVLRDIFNELRCMRSDCRLVGNSKVMAHLFPNLIPPIDRRYTLKFLLGTTTISRGCEKEWLRLRQCLEEFFYPISLDSRFRSKVTEWQANKAIFQWDTSELKTIDNLLIGIAKIQSPKSYISAPEELATFK